MKISNIFKLIAMAVCFIIAGSACLVSRAPDVRGWKCESDQDCLGQLDCYNGNCRGPCPTGEDLDCVSQLNEKCNSDRYCVPPPPPPPTCKSGDTQPCYTGPAATRSKGICKDGTQTCNANNEWGACQGEQLPKKETDNPCNGVDDDCDGQLDNGINCQCKTGETRPCYGGFAGCTKQGDKYSCNGICTAGKQTCQSNSQWGECKDWKGPLDKELCNGLDDDCDGQIDETPSDVNKTCTVAGQEGPCKDGISRCENGTLRCVSSYIRKIEDCNGKDDDCDGNIDNLVPGKPERLRRPCFTGGTGCTKNAQGIYTCKGQCKEGFQVCLDPQGTWDGTCQGEVKPTSPETCNGKDDDCNGDIDDFTVEEGQNCTTKVTTPGCTAGKQICKNGKVECQPQNTSPETCNGKDDDCNGDIDEGNLCPSGQTCSNGTCN